MAIKKIFDNIVHSVKEENKVRKQRNQKKRAIEEEFEKEFIRKYFSNMSRRTCDCDCGCRNEFKPMSMRAWYTNKGIYETMHGVRISTRTLHVCDQCISHTGKSEDRMQEWSDKWAFKSDSQQKFLLGTLAIPMKYIKKPLKEIPYKHQIFLIDALEKEIKNERDEELKKKQQEHAYTENRQNDNADRKFDEERRRFEEEKRSEGKQKPIKSTTMTKKECHEILGVSENASSADIKKAYRELILQWHPDKERNPRRKKKVEEEMTIINMAKERLDEIEEEEKLKKKQ